MFALDNSDSVTHDDFWQMIRFVRDFALGLDIRHNATRIGVVLFSELVQQGIELDEHDDIHGLVSHLYKMQMSKGSARVDEMLRFVRTKSFRRSVIRKGAAQVVIVVTASSAIKMHRTKKQAARARRSGLNFITIGIGGRVREEELRVISGIGDNGELDKESPRVRILPPPPPLSSLDDETAMMMEDLMVGDDPAPISQFTFDGRQEDLTLNNDTNQGEEEEGDILNAVLNEDIELPTPNTDPAPVDLTPLEDGMMEELMLGGGGVEGRVDTTMEVLGVSEDGTFEPVNSSSMSATATATTAGPPIPMFLLEDFTQLEGILMDTVLQTCAAELNDDPVSDQPCGSRQEADLMFVVDSANAGKKNTRKAMDLIRSVAGDMEIDKDKIQLGLVAPDPCAPQEHRQSFNLSQHNNKENLMNNLHTDTSDFSSLVKDLRKTAFRYRNGARKNAKRVAILIVDGKLDNPLNTLTEAQRIREKKGVEIFVISVGDEKPQPEMMMMCDYPHQKHFYQVDNYDRLEEMRETLVDVLCDEL